MGKLLRSPLLLTAQHRLSDLPEAGLLEHHADVVEASQLPGIVFAVHVLQHRYGAPIRHGRLRQSLVHLVTTPRVLEEVGRDEQHPAVAVLDGVTQLRDDGTPRGRVPGLKEATEAFWLALQIGDQFLHKPKVALVVADAHIIQLVPAGAA